MLILTRRIGETIRIAYGDDYIDVVVMEIGRGQVKLGTSAPQHFSVDRLEIFLKKQGDDDGIHNR